MKQQEMAKKFIIELHSIVDVITNSSSELYIFDMSKSEQALREAMQVLIGHNMFGMCQITENGDYIIPDGVNVNNLFEVNIDYGNEDMAEELLKYFNTIELVLK